MLLREALYSLQFSKVTGDPMTAMTEVKGTIPGGGDGRPDGLVVTAPGSTGVEMAWQEKEDVFHRDAFLAGAGHGHVPPSLHGEEGDRRRRHGRADDQQLQGEMTATLRTTALVSLASLLVGIGSARAQQMQPPPFEQREPPRVLPPPPP